MRRMMYIGDDGKGTEFTNEEEMISAIKSDVADYDPDEFRDVEEFQEIFEFALMEMARVYAMHRAEQRKAEKGDSWKEIPTFQLYDFMKTKLDIWTDLDTDEYSALTDLLLTGFMLLTRLAEERGERI